jgi:DNA replication protein DnaC
MRTKDELFRAAQREVAAYRQQAVMQAETARRAAYAAHPALAEADSAHLRAGLGLAKAAALGGNMDTARAALTRADEALAAAVKEAGFSADDFKPAYRCPLCEDTGMRGGVPCRCVADAARRLRRDEINAASPLGLCQFDSFEVERYSDAVEPELGISPREYMGKLLNYCRGYAAKFSQNSPNLLFMGHTGLGKTHLALAIADAVLEGGHDVLYTSAAALAAQLGREHFNYTTNDEWLAACQEADLLILDDLGTEYITPLTISVLYELINTRMLTHRPTIYTTNITDQSVFVARYTEKVASRMLGGCKMFKFFGTDQRLK